MPNNKWDENFRPDGTRVACSFCDKMIDGGFTDLHNHIADNHLKKLPKITVIDAIPDNVVVLGSRAEDGAGIVTWIQYKMDKTKDE